MAARGSVQDASPRSDAYTGLLAISLGALITGCVLLYMDYSDYPDKKPEAYQPPALTPPPARPAAPPAGNPVPPQGQPNK
jgi:hypothetical protein